MVKDEQ